MICYFKGHNFKHIANFSDMKDLRRGLWQCSRCMEVRMDLASEFYDKREVKQPR